MRKIVFFNIPAHGHTNPTLPVVKALADMGHEVIYYSFEPFQQAIEAAGAKFVNCARFDSIQVDAGKVTRDILASTKLIADITLSMDEAVTKELEAIHPDVVVSDSVAFWGKLFAMKLGIPYACSCTTFAFNKESAKVMKSSIWDLIGMLWKLPQTAKALEPLRRRGYPAKNALSILQNDPATPTIVYTSKMFQPCAETFTDQYHFVGPCLRPSGEAYPKRGRPLVYISIGSVLSDSGAFFKNCVGAFGGGDYDVLMSVGRDADIAALGTLPENIRAFPWVDQLAVLQSADVFITHCGMNSASEALYYGVPLVTRPLTPEEGGVANRVAELGAGLPLKDDAPQSIKAAVDAVLGEPRFRAAAQTISQSFRACGGAAEAAGAILGVAG